MKEKLHRIFKVFRIAAIISGCFFIFSLLFAFTNGPFWIYYWLGTSASEYHFIPENIIIMGGSGMPGGDAFQRTYFAAEMAQKFPSAKIYISQPSAADAGISKSDAGKMRSELMLRGVDSSRVYLETEGKNTREEVLNILKAEPSIINKKTVIITSPEHMRRSVLAFRKAGYKFIGGKATFHFPDAVDLKYKDNSLGGREIPLPEVGDGTQLRYQFWNHLQYQVICYREFIALAWYNLRGWI